MKVLLSSFGMYLDIGAETASQIVADGGKAEFTKISVTDKTALENEAKRIFDTYGRIDILINNAGISPR